MVYAYAKTPATLPDVYAGPRGAWHSSAQFAVRSSCPRLAGKTPLHLCRTLPRGHPCAFAQVHGNLYGTSKAAVGQVSEAGKICILDIDIQGVKSVKAADLSPKPIFVFVKVSNLAPTHPRTLARDAPCDRHQPSRWCAF